MAPGRVLISVPKSCFVLKRTRVTPCSIFCANPWQKNIWISSQPDTGTAALFPEVSGPCGGPEVPTGHPSAVVFQWIPGLSLLALSCLTNPLFSCFPHFAVSLVSDFLPAARIPLNWHKAELVFAQTSPANKAWGKYPKAFQVGMGSWTCSLHPLSVGKLCQPAALESFHLHWVQEWKLEVSFT